jgi:putative redox protein
MASDVKTTRADVAETGASPYAVSIEVSGHAITGDEPLDVGGGNLGPAPYDLLTAAPGECTAMTVRWYAIRQNWPLEHVEVTLIPNCIDHDPRVHCRRPMVMMGQG